MTTLNVLVLERVVDEPEFEYSPSLIIAREQGLLVRQLHVVLAAIDLFEEENAALDRQHSDDEVRSRLDLIARAFVYEASTLRALAVDVSNRYPQFADDGRAAVAAFDASLPRLVALRNSQAHLDERLNFQARGKAISTQSLEFDPHRFGAMTPPQACGNTVQGTTETGQHAVIVIGEEAGEAARQLVAGVFGSISKAARKRT